MMEICFLCFPRFQWIDVILLKWDWKVKTQKSKVCQKLYTPCGKRHKPLLTSHYHFAKIPLMTTAKPIPELLFERMQQDDLQ